MKNFEIKTNNGCHLELDFDKNKDGLKVVHKDHKNETYRADLIDAGDLVTLINWYTYQKENGNKNLLF